MTKLTAAWLLAGCLGIPLWAQTPPPPAQPPATQTPPKEAVPAGQVAPKSATSQSPLDHFKEFSAIMTGGPIPGTESPAHIYRSGDLMRMEHFDGNSYQITDLAKQESHGVSRSGACLYYKGPYARSYPFQMSMPGNTYERVPVGKETVDGHVCQVEDLIVHFATKAETAKMRLWEAEDLQGFPVKVETRMHRVIQYTNIVLGPQDPTLFFFPADCQDAGKTIGSGPSPSDLKKKAPAKKPKPVE